MESALVAILLTKLEARNLCDVLPPCEERRKLRNKMLAGDIALNFLRSRDLPEEIPFESPATLSRISRSLRTIQRPSPANCGGRQPITVGLQSALPLRLPFREPR